MKRSHSRHQAHNDPTARYREKGSVRPSRSWLESAISQVREEPSLLALLTMSDMCLDLAIQDTDGAPRHVTAARDSLTEIVDEVTHVEKAGYEREAAQLKPIGIQAALRMTELDNWSKAAASLPVVPSYDTVLRGALIFDPLVVEGKGRNTLIEFMPILLGTRAIDTGRSKGWLARLALLREESRYPLATDTNPNWDTGILLGDSSDEFLSPSVKINLKSRGSKGAPSYAKGGVLPRSARVHGIGDPARIIYSCLSEIDKPSPGIDMLPSLLSSRELDEVTGGLYGTLVLPFAGPIS